MSDSLLLNGLQLARLIFSWNSLGNNTGVGSHSLLQGIFLTQGLNPSLLNWQADSLSLSHLGSPFIEYLLVKEVDIYIVSKET